MAIRWHADPLCICAIKLAHLAFFAALQVLLRRAPPPLSRAKRRSAAVAAAQERVDFAVITADDSVTAADATSGGNSQDPEAAIQKGGHVYFLGAAQRFRVVEDPSM